MSVYVEGASTLNYDSYQPYVSQQSLWGQKLVVVKIQVTPVELVISWTLRVLFGVAGPARR